MPYNPSQPLVVKAEIKINGVWTVITSRTRSAGGVQVKHAQSDGARRPETSRCRVLIGNDDGWLNEDDPRSPWFPHVGRGAPIRLSLTGILGSDAGRFAGKIDRMEAVYPGGDSSSMEIEAIGTWGGLEQEDEELRSPMFRSIAGMAAGDYVPHAYWSMEDGARSAHFAGSLPGGQPMTFSGDVSFAAESTLEGSSPLPTFDPAVIATAIIPTYADTGQWVVQVALRIPTQPAGNIDIVEILSPDGFHTRHVIRCAPGSPSFVTLANYVGDALDDSVSLEFADAAEGQIYGSWMLASVIYTQSGASFSWVFDLYTLNNGQVVASGGGLGATGATGRPATVNIIGASGISCGHLAVFTDPNFDRFTDADANASAMLGYGGETVKERIERLCREEQIPVTVVGETTKTMGPQRTGKITTLLTDCQLVDQGLWSDDRTDLGLVYRTQSDLYTQTPQIAIVRGAITPDTRPVWDYQHIRNDWTITRDGGSSSRQSDEDHVGRIRRRIRDSETLQVDTDDVLAHQARWRVHTGTPRGPRYPDLGINLRNADGALLADSIVELEAGDRITVAAAAFPTQHPPGGANQMVIGWQEVLDADTWELRPVLVPYEPFELVGRWALLSHVLHAAINTSVTSIDIANTDTSQPMLATAAADIGSGYGITIGGEDMQLTAVAASTITVGSAGTASTGGSGSRTPGLPGSAASGDLILIFASTRNLIGVPDTPANWTRLAIFPALANCQVFARIYDGVWSMPTVTFTAGAANEDTIAQSCRLTGKWSDPSKILVGTAQRLNPSAANITYPGLPKPVCDDAIILYFAWKQDDYTSIAGPGTEIQEASSTAGNDASQVWAYAIQTTATSIPSGVFTPTGGAAAVSYGAVAALRCDRQTATVTRGVNGVSASHSAAAAVTATKPMRWGLI